MRLFKGVRFTYCTLKWALTTYSTLECINQVCKRYNFSCCVILALLLVSYELTCLVMADYIILKLLMQNLEHVHGYLVTAAQQCNVVNGFSSRFAEPFSNGTE